MLDISSLRLTDEEMGKFNKAFAKHYLSKDIMDAQLAKALWGIYKWLATGAVEIFSEETAELADELNAQLLAAGMARPEGE